jgi:hypothetical protein
MKRAIKKTAAAPPLEDEGFDYAQLMSEPIEVEWRPKSTPEGKGLKLKLNVDLVTEDFLRYTARTVTETVEALIELQHRQIAEPQNRASRRALASRKSQRAMAKEEREARAKVQQQITTLEQRAEDIRYMARVLGGPPGVDAPEERVIVSWNMTHLGAPVKPSYEFLSTRPFGMLSALYQFCCFEAAAPKKTIGRKSETTS